MKVVILAGGRGTRLGRVGEKIPKPMVKIGRYPILSHIVQIYRDQGFDDFIIATGYKRETIDQWAADYKKREGLDIQCVFTGEDAQTGARLGRIQSLVGPTFMMTYGDGVSDVDLKQLVSYHKSMKPLITLTAVRPLARFGSLRFNSSGTITGFHEKSQAAEGWINGGFMVIESQILALIDKQNDACNFEKDILPEIAETNNLNAYFHTGFWQCMDTSRDIELLCELCEEGAPWLTK